MYASPHVLAAYDDDGYAVLLCLHTGRWQLASPVLASLWRQLSDGNDLSTALAATAAQYQVPASILNRDLPAGALAAARLLTRRRRRPGRITAAVTASGPPARGHTTVPEVAVPGWYLAAAAAAFTAVIAVRHAPLSLQIRFLHLVSRLPGRRPADGIALVAAARRIARSWPGSAECYEISMTAFLAGVFTGQRPRWCLGARLGPFSPHAWIETSGTVIDTDPPQATPCHALIRI
jgi:Transglutaminase-like superfamily